ncbi:ABC transporter ATP-binding protein [Thermodesulforhabdus norvegica]|uniref:Putative ABC transport system ATP-binding protein n=1 Tax=Thermodesulforhabdus norvegica TaxID=39841 RepID=A0A1I4QTX8_9BACT|nr:ATP-binding cassette domain-containing protein [Thermodesulforhabdus norvegica]SFM43532.1 putative ABC transport system ATP-binding protein [Thermodesulforhabdus norvegica]
MLELVSLSKTFNRGTVNEIRAIDEITLYVGKGEFITVIGSNGAGKSTLLNLIAGTYTPDSGKIVLSGEDITGWPEYMRARFIARVFQNPFMGTCGSMTIEENLAIAYRRGLGRRIRRGISEKDRKFFTKRLSILGLGLEHRLKDKVDVLSGGQRQCLTLLMATLRKPQLLLLDEHTAALDPKTAEQVLILTDRIIRDMNLCAIMVTHNMNHAIEMGNRLIMMDRGKVVFDISGEEKSRLTVKDLLDRFSSIRRERFSEDRMLLVE